MEFRPLKHSEYDQLKKFLYYAIYVPAGKQAPKPSIVDQDELRKYYEDFGQANDYSLAAVIDQQIIGLVWCRQFKKNQESYGYYNDDFVELNISILPDYRGKGIGTNLLKTIISELHSNRVKGISLSVSHGNPAQKLYHFFGFKLMKEREEESLMILEF